MTDILERDKCYRSWKDLEFQLAQFGQAPALTFCLLWGQVMYVLVNEWFCQRMQGLQCISVSFEFFCKWEAAKWKMLLVNNSRFHEYWLMNNAFVAGCYESEPCIHRLPHLQLIIECGALIVKKMACIQVATLQSPKLLLLPITTIYNIVTFSNIWSLWELPACCLFDLWELRCLLLHFARIHVPVSGIHLGINQP